jgi:hypothetical protein
LPELQFEDGHPRDILLLGLPNFKPHLNASITATRAIFYHQFISVLIYYIGVMDKAYEYVPLLDNEIRLLEILPGGPGDRIECRMRTVSLENLPAYGALSYVWSEDRTERPIWVDGKRLSAWPNLEAALLAFRREPPTLDPLSHMERMRNFTAAIQNMSSDVPFPPPFVNDNWHQMMAIFNSCFDTISLIAQEARTNMGKEIYDPSEGGEISALMYEKLSQIETLAPEFTCPKTHSWLVNSPDSYGSMPYA